jgi:hypothetical protein
MITRVVVITYTPYPYRPNDMELGILCNQWDDLFALECEDYEIQLFTLTIGGFV